MSLTILLADDSLTIQKVVELTFADTEYDVVAVSSGDELLQKLPETRPELVICDVIMPGRDGYDVCQEIKSSPEHLHLPVILLTGTFEPFDRDRAIAVGCSEIITKPFEAKKLVDAVERLAASPSAPPPQAVDTQSIGPDDLASSAADEGLDDTEVSQEFGPGGVVAEAGFELEADDAPVEEESHELPPVESPPEEPPSAEHPLEEPPPVEPPPEEPREELEFDVDDGALEMDSAELPDVEAPPAVDDFSDLTPDPARTLAAEDFQAMMEAEQVEQAEQGDEFEQLSLDEGPEFSEEPMIEPEPEEEPFPDVSEVADETQRDGPEIETSLTTPIDVDAVMADDQPETELAMDDHVDPPADEATDDADTQDFGDKPPVEDEPTPRVEEVGLSDEDVDRIARRLLELATDRIENIAWDVIPDMAEVVVRERMREIEAEADR
jgi:CheY-like chemotaxis protein